MVDLPNFGTRVRVWPMPNRKVQHGETAILDGGAFMPEDGAEVEFSEFWHRRVLAGEIVFTDPRPRTPEQLKAAAKLPASADPGEAARLAQDRRAAADRAKAALELAVKEAKLADDSAAAAESASIDVARKHLAGLEQPAKKGEK